MRQTILGIGLLALSFSACGGPGGSVGSNALSEEECGQLLTQIDTLVNAEYGVDEPTDPAEFAEDVRQCVEEPAWDRSGFECAMKATSNSQLQRCIFDS